VAEQLRTKREHESPEVRKRVAQLLAMLTDDRPAPSELRRQWYAIAALARIGTPESVAALRDVINRGEADPLARFAHRALTASVRDEDPLELLK
jgi:HEAT repeat protein